MAQPFMGEIRLFSFPFAPRNWAFCAGQSLSVNQNQALFSLLGTMYGGNGVSNFLLPDLRGRAPLNQGAQIPLGTQSGTETVLLSGPQLPTHPHTLQASTATATLNSPAAANALGTPAAGKPIYAPPTGLAAMNSATLGNSGNQQPHPNMQPSLVLNFCIALSGIYPTRS
ncbi:MAG TPA: tail fiber protein [bacterium]|jgi:microcystin-dependent protein|nr:tail fiber protein [bacterium]